MNRLVKGLCLFLAFALLSAGQQAYAAADKSPGTAAKPLPKEIPLSGRVVETMDGGGYTYVLLDGADGKVWVAAPLMKVTVGQELALVPGFEMKNFTSKGLNRKFDRVVFSAGVVNNKGIKLSPSALKMAHQGVPTSSTQNGEPAGRARATKGAKAARVSIVQIGKAKGPNAYTVAQLYAKKTMLEKKPIVVRGRVVKVSPGILKRNWIHLQDGTGTEGRKNNNLVVTTRDLPNVGDVVTARGILYNNLDFGSGYRYTLLIEKARMK